MKKIAIIVLLSFVFVSIIQSALFAIDVPLPDVTKQGAVTTEEEYIRLPDGRYKRTTKTTIDPSVRGASIGAAAGATGGAAIGSFIPIIGTAVGAGIGALAGGIAGWIWRP